MSLLFVEIISRFFRRNVGCFLLRNKFFELVLKWENNFNNFFRSFSKISKIERSTITRERAISRDRRDSRENFNTWRTSDNCVSLQLGGEESAKLWIDAPFPYEISEDSESPDFWDFYWKSREEKCLTGSFFARYWKFNLAKQVSRDIRDIVDSRRTLGKTSLRYLDKSRIDFRIGRGVRRLIPMILLCHKRREIREDLDLNSMRNRIRFNSFWETSRLTICIIQWQKYQY